MLWLVRIQYPGLKREAEWHSAMAIITLHQLDASSHHIHKMQRSQSSFAFKCKSNALDYARLGGPDFFQIKISENTKVTKSNRGPP